MTEYIVQDTSLTAVANKIREKTGGVAPLEFPDEFIIEINTLSKKPVTPVDSILFFSYDSFTLGIYNKLKNWDGTLYYSGDHATWTEWDGSVDITAAEFSGWYYIYLKGDGISYMTDGTSDSRFVLTGSAVKCVGNMRNVLSVTSAGDMPAEQALAYLFYNCITLDFDIEIPYATMNRQCYQSMFANCTSLTKAPVLSSTVLAYQCYSHMFEGCKSLKNMPSLPALELPYGCYEYMFTGCTSLTSVSNLPATTFTGTNVYSHMFENCTSLINPPTISSQMTSANCYTAMFNSCTSLTSAPALPAATVDNGSYYSMFNGCTALTTAPALPATTLGTDCYHSMFNGCTALTSAPALPATTLNNSCYRDMFNKCSNLESLPELPATTLKSYCYNGMFYNCSKIKLSATQTGDYQTAFRIPSSGTGTTASSALNSMFTGTGGTFKSTPSINTTYYTSNTVIPAS